MPLGMEANIFTGFGDSEMDKVFKGSIKLPTIDIKDEFQR